MTPIDEEAKPSEADSDPTDSDDMERSLTPMEETTITPDLLDQLFESEDPRVQSGISEDESDDDLDFIRMSGLTSPEVSDDIDSITEPPRVESTLTPPVSFYEPGIADVDAAMMPESSDGNADTAENETRDTAANGLELDASLIEDSTGPLDNDIVEPHADADESDDQHVIDLDAMSEEDVFPDLVAREVADVKEPDVEAPDVTGDAAPEPSAFDFVDTGLSAEATNDEVELVEFQENQNPTEEKTEDDQTLVVPDRNGDEDAPLNDSIFDDILVDTEHEGSADQATPSVQTTPVVPVTKIEAKVHREPDDPSTVQIYGRRSNSHHHRRHESSSARFLKIAAVLLVFGAALSFVGYEGYRWFQIRISNPTTLFYEAENAAVNSKHLQASRLFEEFVRRNPEHPLAADAMFAAGYQMQQVESEDEELINQYNEESLALLGEFTRRYPDHQRVGRAHSLMGIVHYRRGDYRAAVDAFIDRDAILRDPAATLPMLRTLARAYAQLGEYEAAHSTFIRAANTPSNPSPDLDYDELGEMYRALAQNAETPELHTAYRDLALEHWSHAIRYPGINPTRKNTIRVKVDLLGELGELKGSPTTVRAQKASSDLVVPLDGALEPQPATFELTAPLSIGPIVKGVRGNDEPESVGDRVEAVQAEGPSTVVEPAPVDQPNEDEAYEMAISVIDDLTVQPTFHEIAPGEQLYRIALDYGIPAADLMRWNQIEDANHIQAGQRLVLHEPVMDVE